MTIQLAAIGALARFEPETALSLLETVVPPALRAAPGVTPRWCLASTSSTPQYASWCSSYFPRRGMATLEGKSTWRISFHRSAPLFRYPEPSRSWRRKVYPAATGPPCWHRSNVPRGSGNPSPNPVDWPGSRHGAGLAAQWARRIHSPKNYSLALDGERLAVALQDVTALCGGAMRR